MRKPLRRLLAPAIALGLLAALPAAAEYPDWQSVSDVGVIELATRDEDGDLRVTKVWFVLIDGEPYLRTSDTRWLENLRRDPDLLLHIEDEEYEARALEVTTPEIIERVDTASREKYGWQDRFVHAFRRGEPDILKLSPRE